ncbi:Hypothetical protein FKW44_021029 [Caligus rogercresseyi]|uniref:Uncharacterized protein n=1 Tax=Caligus rogercresseyi TaxID=217165 RepID=A0A7T8JV07_CALRO|nr:Hypothetical protein FKW44_021029 [Caligus rogercresseyi]
MMTEQSLALFNLMLAAHPQALVIPNDSPANLVTSDAIRDLILEFARTRRECGDCVSGYYKATELWFGYVIPRRMLDLRLNEPAQGVRQHPMVVLAERYNQRVARAAARRAEELAREAAPAPAPPPAPAPEDDGRAAAHSSPKAISEMLPMKRLILALTRLIKRKVPTQSFLVIS